MSLDVTLLCPECKHRHVLYTATLPTARLDADIAGTETGQYWRGHDDACAGMIRVWRSALENPIPNPGFLGDERLERLYRDTERLRKTLNDHLESEAAETMRANRLREELAAAKKDADRYRWLRDKADHPAICEVLPDGEWVPILSEYLDARVDAAMAQEKRDD